MIPVKILSYGKQFPVFEEVTKWQLLRKWSLSEVYRITLQTGDTQIVKWGGNEMVRETDIYKQLLEPLRIRSPHIYGYYADDSGGIMLMEDAGERDLEQQPDADSFLEAARELARLRLTAAASLKKGAVSESIRVKHLVTAADFVRQLDDLSGSNGLINDPIIQRAREWLPEHIEKLYRQVPLTLVHHDYHAKNLLLQGERILPIDWSNAYLSPHLGDLYCLIMDSDTASLSSNAIIGAYLNESQSDQSEREQLMWQLRIGGLCWLVRTLRWLVFGGTDTIPGSDLWIPDLITDMGKLLNGSAFTDFPGGPLSPISL